MREIIDIAIIDDSGYKANYFGTIEVALNKLFEVINSHGKITFEGNVVEVEIGEIMKEVNWDDAIRSFQEKQVDLTLLDIFDQTNLHNYTPEGFKVLKEIREIDKTKGHRTEVLLMTRAQDELIESDKYMEFETMRLNLQFTSLCLGSHFDKIAERTAKVNETHQGVFLLAVFEKALMNIIDRRRERTTAKEAKILKQEVIQLKNEQLNHIVGDNYARDEVSSYAALDLDIFLAGDSGTGKTFIAEIIHKLSIRKAGNFVRVNCVEIPPDMLSSELFGYEKGAYSGAITSKAGLIEKANGGTLFLDEIGLLRPTDQEKLLTVLGSGIARRLGSTKDYRSDFRLIFATNKNLAEEVNANNFRHDLFFRLWSAHKINLLPLKERGQHEIISLISYYKQVYTQKNNISFQFNEDAYKFLLTYHYPGNIRILEGIIVKSLFESIKSDGFVSLSAVKKIVEDLEIIYSHLKPKSPVTALSTSNVSFSKKPDWFDKIDDSELRNRLNIFSNIENICIGELHHFNKLKESIFKDYPLKDDVTIWGLFCNLKDKKYVESGDMQSQKISKFLISAPGEQIDFREGLFTCSVVLLLLNDYTREMSFAEFKAYVVSKARDYFGYGTKSSTEQNVCDSFLSPMAKNIGFLKPHDRTINRCNIRSNCKLSLLLNKALNMVIASPAKRC